MVPLLASGSHSAVSRGDLVWRSFTPGRTPGRQTAHAASTAGFPKSPLFPRRDGHAITGNALGHAWRKAARGVGLGQYHVHDLRHASLTAAAQAGGTTRELMARAGHRTARAALIYQHAAEERSAVLAEAMDALAGGAIAGRSSRLEAVLRLEIPGP